MAVLDEEFGDDLRQIEGDGRMEPSSALMPVAGPCDFRSRYERERARADREQAQADTAEARCEELRWAEVAARSDAGLWKSRFRKCRSKLTAAEEETKALRRAAREVPGLQAVVGRPEAIRSEYGIESSQGCTIQALRKEIARLHNENAKLVAASDARDHRIGYLEYEARQLRKDLQGADTHKETIRQQFNENLELRAERRRLRDRQDTVRRQSSELYRLNVALEVSETQNGRLKVRLAKLIAETLANSPRRFVPLFEPLFEAIPRTPEHRGAASRRRDRLARARASWRRPLEPSLAVGLGQQRRGLLPYRCEPQRRGGAEPVRRGRAQRGHRVRPLQRLQEARAPSRGSCDAVMVLEICCAHDYVAESGLCPTENDELVDAPQHNLLHSQRAKEGHDSLVLLPCPWRIFGDLPRQCPLPSAAIT